MSRIEIAIPPNHFPTVDELADPILSQDERFSGSNTWTTSHMAEASIKGDWHKTGITRGTSGNEINFKYLTTTQGSISNIYIGHGVTLRAGRGDFITNAYPLDGLLTRIAEINRENHDWSQFSESEQQSLRTYIPTEAKKPQYESETEVTIEDVEKIQRFSELFQGGNYRLTAPIFDKSISENHTSLIHIDAKNKKIIFIDTKGVATMSRNIRQQITQCDLFKDYKFEAIFYDEQELINSVICGFLTPIDLMPKVKSLLDADKDITKSNLFGNIFKRTWNKVFQWERANIQGHNGIDYLSHFTGFHYIKKHWWHDSEQKKQQPWYKKVFAPALCLAIPLWMATGTAELGLRFVEEGLMKGREWLASGKDRGILISTIGGWFVSGVLFLTETAVAIPRWILRTSNPWRSDRAAHETSALLESVRHNTRNGLMKRGLARCGSIAVRAVNKLFQIGWVVGAGVATSGAAFSAAGISVIPYVGAALKAVGGFIGGLVGISGSSAALGIGTGAVVTTAVASARAITNEATYEPQLSEAAKRVKPQIKQDLDQQREQQQQKQRQLQQQKQQQQADVLPEESAPKNLIKEQVRDSGIISDEQAQQQQSGWPRAQPVKGAMYSQTTTFQQKLNHEDSDSDLDDFEVIDPKYGIRAAQGAT